MPDPSFHLDAPYPSIIICKSAKVPLFAVSGFADFLLCLNQEWDT